MILPSIRRSALQVALLSLSASIAIAGSGLVPDDFPTIQQALDQAAAGDTILVRDDSGPYREKLELKTSGDLVSGFFTLEAFPGDRPILDGTGLPPGDMILIDTLSYVRVRGFEIRNNLDVSDASGVRVLGSGSHIEILDNEIHDIRGSDAMGITVYATDPTTSISDLVIDGNVIYDCEPARSEALTLNGNVERFAVTNNIVRDVNNIGIDFIGGETDINPDPTKVARDGVCRGNQVYRANSSYGGGYGAGIYVDGGRDIIIERNIVTDSDLGIEIGAENAGVDATGIIVRDNFVYRNDKVGIVFGGYDAAVGRVTDCQFSNNTLFGNDTFGEGLGELWIQYAERNVVTHNIFFSSAQNVLLYSEAGNVQNQLDHNLWYTPSGTSGELVWRGTSYIGIDAFRAGTGQAGSSFEADPLLVDPLAGNLHLTEMSPARDAGDPAFVAGPGETDFDGDPRVGGPRVELGADELPSDCVTADLGVVGELRAVRAGDGIVFAWGTEPNAGSYHVNAVAAKLLLDGDGPHRMPRGAAQEICEATSDDLSCVDADAMVAGASPYYQVVSSCGAGGDLEGPSE